jgi:hypothetical protein
MAFVGPANPCARLAGVFVDDDKIEEQLAAHVFFADRILLYASRAGPIGNVFVQQGLSIVRRPILP